MGFGACQSQREFRRASESSVEDSEGLWGRDALAKGAGGL